MKDTRYQVSTIYFLLSAVCSCQMFQLFWDSYQMKASTLANVHYFSFSVMQQSHKFFFFFFFKCAKTFLNLMAHISKEQTVQYILTLIDDTLQVATYPPRATK